MTITYIEIYEKLKKAGYNEEQAKEVSTLITENKEEIKELKHKIEKEQIKFKSEFKEDLKNLENNMDKQFIELKTTNKILVGLSIAIFLMMLGLFVKGVF